MKKYLLISALFLILLAGWYAWTRYQWIYEENINISRTEHILYIQPGTTSDAFFTQLASEGLIDNRKALEWVAERMQFGDSAVIPGRYSVKPGMSNYAFLRMIRAGNQAPVRLTINRKDSLAKLIGYAAEKLMPDSLSMMQYVVDSFLPGSNFTEETILSLFIPNTYEFYWTCTPSCFVERMQQEHARFWNRERTNKLQTLNLTEVEVYTLASIVERETIHDAEKPSVAGVYLNRLEKNMHLQADPTVIFAVGDWSIRRVLHKHLAIDSPYNTYMYPGLPPGPICMPGIKSIDAVLNPLPHDYLFFCADPESPGKHLFAETLAGHQRNARAYQRWANRNGLK